MKGLPPRLSSKNLRRYAHTQTFNRLAGRGRLRGLKFRDRAAGRKIALAMGLCVLLYLLAGMFFVLF